MKNFNQTYRIFFSIFFLCVFTSILVIDFSCFVGRVASSQGGIHTHLQGHSRHYNHQSEKVIILKNVSLAKDNSCCKEEVMGYYSAIKKVLISKFLQIDLPLELFISLENKLPTFSNEISFFKPLLSCNKAPPFIIKHIYLNNSILII